MVSSAAMKVSFLLLLTLFSSLQIHARDSQFFNKVSSTTSNNVVPNREPNFQPENENGYGLFGHESGQLPPSATKNGEPTTTTTTSTSTDTTTLYNADSKEPQHKYLPKNYNPVAYVTEPEDTSDIDNPSFSDKTYTNNLNSNNYYNDAQNYYNNQQEEEETSEPEYRGYTTATTNNNNYDHYNGGSSFNSDPQGLSDTRFMGGATRSSRHNYYYNSGETNSFQPQGMSDTRFLENGKYFYNINTEKYSHNHPYESLKGVRARNEHNDRNYYGNSENSMRGYQNQYEFQDEESMP